MPTYRAPLEEFHFLLHDVLPLSDYAHLTPFTDADPEILDTILNEGSKFIEERLVPLNLSGDSAGCHWQNGTVSTPEGFKAAYTDFCAAGWTGLIAHPDYGGQGLPQLLGFAFAEILSAANLSFAMYPGLTTGAYEAIWQHGSPEQKALYLPRLTSGEWSGTMNLTEPHCGTDLSLLRTKATPQTDGSYQLTGTKIFISAGEHDLTSNIIHLVLARLPNAPEGVHGISLFIVPKYLVNSDGSLGARNAVHCGGLEHKMGIHANATCLLNYDGATGYLLGQPHKGMKAMFTMMNAARLVVGIQGLGLAEVAYQNALLYVKQRRQGRSPAGAQDPQQPADLLIAHPDIRRMLMIMKTFIEGGRNLVLMAGLQLDIAAHHPDANTRTAADGFVSLITPVIKAYFTDKGFECTNLALQCFGGHGYIHEWGMEQFVRDARITQIYEGANAIHALDLIARKVPAKMGAAMRYFIKLIQTFIEKHETDKSLHIYLQPLHTALQNLQKATAFIVQLGLTHPEQAAARATDYLHLFALVTFAYSWAQMAIAATQKINAGETDNSLYQQKIITARFFMQQVLPDSTRLLTLITNKENNLLNSQQFFQ